MRNKYLVTVSILTIFLSTFVITYAQEENKEDKITQPENVMKYMEVIAADSSMRKEMMNLMLDNCKGDKNALMEMGNSMMQNQEMNNIMTELMKNNTMIESDMMTDKKMKDDSMPKEKMEMKPTKTIKKPKYDSKIKE